MIDELVDLLTQLSRVDLVTKSSKLLLTGGVVLAQSLIVVEPGCFQSWLGAADEFDQQQPGYPCSYTWASCGWLPGEPLYYTETFANGFYYEDPYDADEDGCQSSEGVWGWTCEGQPAHHGPEAATGSVEAVFPDDFWGRFEICVESAGNSEVSARQIACATILFAEDCVMAEFVPEPATILLLGSGLAGLAGYATLRWRSRQ